MNHFAELSIINVNDKVEKKNGLTYLSWAWAWGELKKVCPEANYTVYENKDGWNYHTDGKTCWVKTGVTADGIEHIEYLPIMDMRNKSIPADNVNSFDVNKAIQRSLTKAVARHGLGLYIYAGEDLPDGEAPEGKPDKVPDEKPANTPEPAKAKPPTRAQRIATFYTNHNITDVAFKDYLKALRESGQASSKTTAEMDETEFSTMLQLIHKRVEAITKTAIPA